MTDTSHHSHRRQPRILLPMVPRDASETHRAATPLELFFDLCFVVAIALAASELHHDIAEDHILDGLLGFAMVFFAIWWAWMNFTWFASAYDTDDSLYRVATFVQMAGVLILAAGVPRAFDSNDYGLITGGYVVMRVALVAQWLRAAHMDVEGRRTALIYAAGISVLQVFWVARLALDGDAANCSLPLLVVAELLVPVMAECSRKTSWHPGHITERYGLFTIIVLGESILAATTAFQVVFDAGLTEATLITLAVSSVLIVFTLWWLYFDQTDHPEPGSYVQAITWGYGHYFILGAGAAVGAAIAVAVDHETHHTEISDVAAGLALGVPVALFLAGVWLIRVLPGERALMDYLFPVAAVAVLAVAATPVALPGIAVVLVLLVALMLAEPRLVARFERR